MVWVLLWLIFLLWDLCWFSWLFSETRAMFGLTSYADVSRKMFTNCFECGFWLHCYKVKQTILFYYSCLHVFSNTRNEKKHLSMAVVVPPKASVDLEFALGNTEDLKRLFSPFPLRGNFHLFFSCHFFISNFPSPSPFFFEDKRNNAGRLETRRWESVKER